MWEFAYPEGARSIAALYVPAGQPIKLIMTARDVIHSFYVPDFRIKQDVIPGRYTTVWFQSNQIGKHPILCAEYCGAGHSTMRGEVVVLEPADYARWLEGLPERRPAPPLAYVEPAVIDDFAVQQKLDLVRIGERAAAEHGCLRCHTLDGTPHIGPTWAGLYLKHVRFADGSTAVADEGYLTESMMDPAAKQVAGFALVMPSYFGLIRPAETAGIVELIRSLRDVPAQAGAASDSSVEKQGAQLPGETVAPLPRKP
jgi:cytochrome c oxidase subunit 2